MKRKARLGILAISLISGALAQINWKKIEYATNGRTVLFNAWFRSEAINDFIAWATDTVQQRDGLTDNHVTIADAAEVIKRMQTKIQSKRTERGTINLMWINGKSFKDHKQIGILLGLVAEPRPNWPLVDQSKPVRVDFSVSTEGMEAPWGTDQRTFVTNRVVKPTPPRSANELSAFVFERINQLGIPTLLVTHDSADIPLTEASIKISEWQCCNA